jgi:hypothetical protein
MSKLLHYVTQFSQLIFAALFVPPSFPIKKSIAKVRDKKDLQSKSENMAITQKSISPQPNRRPAG